MFSYSPLNREVVEIRLVRFIEPPADSTTTPIQLELRHAPLLNDETRYEAVSYAWGNPSESHAAEICVNGSPFTISPNLQAGLLQIRENGVRSWLWVDSICIQQTDLQEKAWQISQMNAIFSRAALLYVWVGPSDEYTDAAMDFVDRIGPRAVALGTSDLWTDWQQTDWNLHQFMRGYLEPRYDYPRDQQSADEDESEGPALFRFMFDLLNNAEMLGYPLDEAPVVGKGINSLMQREYWCRIWMIQEIALAAEARVLCGTKTVCLDSLDAALCIMEQCLYFSSTDKNCNLPNNIDGLVVFRTLAMITRRRRLRGDPIRLVDILYQFASPVTRPYYLATDPRDIVFGVLAVVANRETIGLKADYNMTPAEVFEAATRVLINDCEGKYPARYSLDRCVPRNEGEDTGIESLPSWVPDWRQIGRRGSGVPSIHGQFDIDATAATPIPPLQNQLQIPGVLRRHGCRVDVIEKVMERPSDPNDAQAYFSSLLDFSHSGTSTGPGEDYVWRVFLRGTFEEKFPGTGDDPSIASMIRSIFRGDHINIEMLTPKQKQFLDYFLYRSDLVTSRGHLPFSTKLSMVKFRLLEGGKGATAKRIPFKPFKGMLGIGHLAVRAGDIVTLLWGVKSPIILRPRGDSKEGGYTFVGDTYIDGIMHGEFLKTLPAHEIFDIY